MPIRSDPLDELAIPDGTTVEEHDLVTDGDVIVGGQSTVEFGVRGNNVIAGERVEFGGHIEAESDCRLDMWSDVAGDVLVGNDAYLGERVHLGGELKVAGDLDIGDDVDIEDGFEANGWIVIRNPMPTIVFLVIYLSQLLRLGEEEAAEQLASQLVAAQNRENQPVLVPRGTRVSDDVWRVSTPATIGGDCRLHGNIRAESLSVGSSSMIFGSLRARGDVSIAEDTEIKGDVTTRSGDVRIDRGAHVWGDVSAADVELHEHAVVEGTIRVSGELTQIRDVLGPEPADHDRAESDHDQTESDPEDQPHGTEHETTGSGDDGTSADSDESPAGSDGIDVDDEAESTDPERESEDPKTESETAEPETAEPEPTADTEPIADPDGADDMPAADADGSAVGTADADGSAVKLDESAVDDGGSDPGDPDEDTDVQSRAEIEDSLEGFVPLADAGDGYDDNGHDEDAEVVPDAD